MLLIQSVEGHAHEGHGAFNGRRYPNTTLDHITRALRLDPNVIKAERQALIIDVFDYVDRALAGDSPPTLVTENGTPLFGISFLRLLKVNLGTYFAGYISAASGMTRTCVSRWRRGGTSESGSKAYYVDFAVMRRMGLSADELAKESGRATWSDSGERD